MSDSETRGANEWSDPMTGEDVGRGLAILATEVRMSRDELTRRFDEQGKAFVELRKEMTSNYVTREHHSSEIGRLTDRVRGTESDLVDLRTQQAAALVDLHGHIDRRFDESAISRRFIVGIIVSVALALLTAATAIIVAVLQNH